MSKQQESIGRTLLVAFVMCLVCSVIVASAAVMLKPVQLTNSLLDKQRNILVIAGLIQPEASAQEVQRVFRERIQPRLVDLDSGRFVEDGKPETFDPLQAAKDPAQSSALSGEDDIASIRRREHRTVVYQVTVTDDDERTIAVGTLRSLFT